jgi:heptosyltransferase-2
MKPSRVLVRAPNWIGDAVMSLGAVRDVRRNFPAATIDVLARPWVADLYGAVSEVDAVRRTGTFWADVGSLRGAFDLAVLLPNSFGSALQVFAARIPERWGFATDGRRPLLTRGARLPREELRGSSEVYYYRAMLSGLGLEVCATPDVSLRPPAGWAARGAELLGSEGPWIGINAGAAFGSAKQWIPERFAAIAHAVRTRFGARIAVVGGPADRSLGQRIARGLGASARVLCGETTLPELIGVLSQLRLLVTNDSGPMHLASAQGVPVVAVFGPTDCLETAPVRSPHHIVREEVDCSPCKLRECPIDHRCMTLVTVDRVMRAVAEVMA